MKKTFFKMPDISLFSICGRILRKSSYINHNMGGKQLKDFLLDDDMFHSFDNNLKFYGYIVDKIMASRIIDFNSVYRDNEPVWTGHIDLKIEDYIIKNKEFFLKKEIPKYNANKLMENIKILDTVINVDEHFEELKSSIILTNFRRSNYINVLNYKDE